MTLPVALSPVAAALASRRARACAATSVALLTLAGCGRLDDLWARAQSAQSETDAAVESQHVAHGGPATEEPSARHAHAAEPAHADGGAAAVDAALANAEPANADAGAAADAAPAGPTLTALFVWVPVYARMDQSGPRLGYLRAGASVHVGATPAGTDGCARGWYEVQGGGYLCLNRMVTLDASELGRHPILQPDLSSALPYPYMTTYRAVAMYRWLPSTADMREVEPERFGLPPAGTPAIAAGADAGAAPIPLATAPGGMVGAPAMLTTAPTTGTAPGPDAGAALLSGAAATVANRAQAEDAGVRIEDLAGQAGTPLLRRLLSGMYVSVDREATSAGRRFWRTQSGGYLERGAVSPLRNAPTFQGVVLDEQHPQPIAFMVAYEGWTYDLSPDGHTATRRERAPRLTAYSLTSDPPVTIGRNQYLRTTQGFYVTARNTRQVRTVAPPADLASPNEKWIEVNLDRQMLIAYEGARPVYATLVSTGRRNEDNPERNYETVQGGFRIQSKHVATTMDGNTAGDGPYSIEDVPWVMYFENSFAMHGAFWHSAFGAMHSHGCVNMAPADARWVFQWSEPALPAGWHGVYSNAEHPGTRVYVHYERQRLGEHGGPDVVPQH